MKQQGPFDRLLESGPRRERAPLFILIAIAALAILLLILVLPPISILSDGDSAVVGPGGISSQALSNEPAPPEGFRLLSRLYQISAPEGGSAVLTVNLDETVSEDRNLSLFTYTGDTWQRLGPAQVTADGTAAQGEVTTIPENVAVLEGTSTVRQVVGWLRAGNEVDPSALPLLSAISPLDFAPAADGSILGEPSPLPADSSLSVYPTIRALVPPESEAVAAILASPDLQQEHVAEIVRVADEGSYDGIDIDYRAVSPGNRVEFSQFIALLAEELHKAGHSLTLTLPLPTREGVDWDTGAYDWSVLGEAADAIKLAPERDQSVYFERMEDVLDFVTSQVDSSKILLTVSPFSNEKDVTGVRPLTFTQAMALATTMDVRGTQPVEADNTVTIVGQNIFEEEGASGLFWDDAAAAVSFVFAGEGGAHTVWIENSFSVAFKLELVERFDLGGVAVEDVTANSGGGDIWPPLAEFAASGTVGLVRPNDALMRTQWSADAGTLEDGAHGSVTWQAPPEAGFYNVTLVVGDGMVRMGQRLSLEVVPAGEAPAAEEGSTPEEEIPAEATPPEEEILPEESPP